VPRFIQWTRRQHGAYPAEYIYRAEPALRIRGRVLDDDGQPVAGAMVRLAGPAPNFAGDAKEFLMFTHSYAISDATGRWDCHEVPPSLAAGDIGLRVLHPQFQSPPARTLTESELGGANIETRLSGGAVITGSVVDAQGRPQAGAKLLTRSANRVDRIAGVTTDKDGNFTLRVAPTPVVSPVLVQVPGFAPQTIQLPAPNNGAQPARIVVSEGRSVMVQVIDQKQRPLDSALIEGIAGNGITLDPRILTDREGLAFWRHAPADRLILRISRDGYVPRMFAVDPTATNLTAVLDSIRTLAGSVTDARSGRRIPFFKILPATPDPNASPAAAISTPIGVGHDGAFRLAAEGTDGALLFYRIEAPGYAPSSAIPISKLEGPVPYAIRLTPL